MRRTEKILLYFCGAVMDFTWLYAWAIFSMISIGKNGFPLADTAAIFIAAAALTRICAGRGLRIITLGLLQAAGLAAAALRGVYLMSGATGAFLDPRWLVEFWTGSHSDMEWFGLVIALFFTSAIWLGGAFFAVRPAAHAKICSRFDLGLAAFFGLVLITMVLVVKGGMPMGDTLTGPLACIFFFFGLLAIGMTRATGAASSGFIGGRRRLGVVMGFICAVFLSVISLVAFFQQALARAAGTGYGLLKDGASSVGSIFLWCVKFLYLPRQAKIREGPSGSQGSILDHLSPSDSAQWVEVAGTIAAWLFGTFLGLTILVVTVVAAASVIRWLFSRTAKNNPSGMRRSLPRAVLRVFGLIVLLIGKAGRTLRGYSTAADFYRALSGWSRRSGVRPDISETPSEFSSRLSRKFPALEGEIEAITGAFNKEFYGEITLRGEEIDIVRLSWRKLRNPACWPVRLKTLFSGTVTPLP